MDTSPPPPAVDTERLRLAPFAPADEDALLALYRDDHVRRYLLDGALVDRAWVRAEIEASQRRFAAGSLGIFAARVRDDDRLAGFAGFRPDHQPPVLELLYALLPAFCGRGLAAEMARAMLRLAFDGRGHDAVRAAVDVPNHASIRLLERLGMTVERTSPGAFGPMLHYVLPRERFTLTR
jgi:RimJ/RimL family protein N-acetyltransferase